MAQPNKQLFHIFNSSFLAIEDTEIKIRHSPSFLGILGVLEEIKEEINNINTVKSTKYRRPLWDERGLARLLKEGDVRAEGQ